ncbi:SAP domain-containing protein [Clostridium sp. 1001275B_160808_H3]|jgi:SAP domain|uniref:SAP domain-containing protein n=1 Tax=Clostridium sp. 1001275B_160808_H3 TaxID=2787110 RepID=UPI001898F875|nr:SAP domain-containing protein [Clostridium sp. 1001275B_160808_H3]
MGFLDFFKRKKKINSNIDDNISSIKSLTNEIKHYSYNDYKKLKTISVFLNWAQKGYSVGLSNTYPSYMKYELDIANPSQFHKEMISNGYLEKPDLDSLFVNFKVSELKQILSDNNLPKTGNKSCLIERILNNISEESLKKIQNNFTGYVLSEKGKAFINKNYDFIEMHKNPNWMISLDEYVNKKRQLKFDTSFYDIAWGIFNDRNIQYVSEKNWGLVRNNILNMYEILIKENKPKESLSFLLSVLYYDLSGLKNNNMLYKFEDIGSAPGIIDRILKLKDFYSDDLINDCAFLKQLPFSYFSIDTFKLLVNDLIENDEINLNAYKKYIQTPNKNLIDILKE